jgi:RNA polymerase sigma-70 factor (ECF subfamily)
VGGTPTLYSSDALSFLKNSAEIFKILISSSECQNEVTRFMSPNESAADPLPTRASLVSRLKHWDDQESWRDFFSTYWKLIYNVATKAGLDDSSAQDVVQETIIAVARKLRDFKYDPQIGSFKAWLLTITRRRILDHFRAGYRDLSLSKKADDGQADRATPLLARIPDPGQAWECLWDEEWEKNLWEVALENAKKKTRPRQYQIFDCFVLKNWPMQQVKTQLGVSSGQIYFAKYKVSAVLQKELRALRRRAV